MMLGTTMTMSSLREALKGMPLVMLALSCNSERTTTKPLASAAAQGSSAPAPAVLAAPKIHLSGAGIDRVLLQRRGHDAVRLEKKDGSWMIVSSTPVVPADSSTLETLFADLDRTEFVAPVRDAPDDGLYVHVVAERGETSVLDAWIGGQSSPHRQLYRAEGSREVWVARYIAPWILFATAKDFGARKSR